MRRGVLIVPAPAAAKRRSIIQALRLHGPQSMSMMGMKLQTAERAPEKHNAKQDIDDLAAVLLDLESTYEYGLRTLISIHRLCERVRGATETSQVRLLTGEMLRQTITLADNSSTLHDRITAMLDQIRPLPQLHE